MDDWSCLVDCLCYRVSLWAEGTEGRRGRKLIYSILPLYYLVRRPTHILDFALTLNFNHLILTTYYAKSFPTSIYYWVVQALGALLMIVVAEQASRSSSCFRYVSLMNSFA
jgi:hypothetical protein